MSEQVENAAAMNPLHAAELEGSGKGIYASRRK